MAFKVRRLGIGTKAAGVAAAAMGAVALIPSVAQANDYSISRVAGITGSSAAATPGVALLSAIGTPYSVVTDGLGNVLVSDYNNNRIYNIAADGTLSRVAASMAFNRPVDLYVDAAGNLIVSDYYNYLVRQISSSGTATTLAGNGFFGVPSAGSATSTPIGTPWGLVKDAAGNLYISDANDNRIYKVGRLP